MTSFLLVALAAAVAVSPSVSTTVGQQSGFTRTGRYEEVVRLCAAYEQQYPGRAKCHRFGTTPEGRPMLAIAVSDDGTLHADEAKVKGRPVVLAQGGIHAGEIDGKDAGFWLLPDLLSGRVAKGALSAVTFVFVPVFNVDGHERFGTNNRPNQRGPEEMGWRTTSQNLNLNRDYAKADTPEMHAMLDLLHKWDPVLYIDLHVTDGAKFRHDIAILVDPAEVSNAPLRATARKLRADVLDRLKAKGHLPLDFYPSFETDDDPTSGFAVGAGPPRLSNPYWGARGRMGMLVETHSWRTYKERVTSTRDLLEAVLVLATKGAAAWQSDVDAGDDAAKRTAGQDVVLQWTNTGDAKTIDFQGYRYDRTPSAISGKLKIVYDEGKPETWKLPLMSTLKPVLTVKAPAAGYIIAPGYAALVAQRLALHGFKTVPITTHRNGTPVEAFRATEVKFSERPYEGRMTAKVKGAWAKEKVDVAPGSIYVPVDQPGSRLLLSLLEPEAPDSFTSWGFFNAAFEQKEYMEDYVAEEWAAELMKKDPAVKAAFEKRLASDAAFAADPKQRLDFFYRRHPSYDARKDMVPVFRVDVF